jgi:hypothetical protein
MSSLFARPSCVLSLPRALVGCRNAEALLRVVLHRERELHQGGTPLSPLPEDPRWYQRADREVYATNGYRVTTAVHFINQQLVVLVSTKQDIFLTDVAIGAREPCKPYLNIYSQTS